MAGLFTLDSDTLGILDTSVLGGFGTDFFDTQSTSAFAITETVTLTASSITVASSSISVTSTATMFASSNTSATSSESVVSTSTLKASSVSSSISTYSITTASPPSSNVVVAGDARHLKYLLPDRKKEHFTASSINRSRNTYTIKSTIKLATRSISKIESRATIYATHALHPVVITIDKQQIRQQREEELLLLEII